MSLVNPGAHLLDLLAAAIGTAKVELMTALAGPHPKLRASHLRLLSLTPAHGMRPTELAARAGMTKQSIGEFIAALEKAGYLSVKADPADRRARIVQPTAEGLELKERIGEVVATMEGRWRDEVGAGRWAAFREVLSHLASPPNAPGKPAE